MIFRGNRIELERGEPIATDDLELRVDTDISTMIVYFNETLVEQGKIVSRKIPLLQLKIPNSILQKRRLLN